MVATGETSLVLQQSGDSDEEPEILAWAWIVYATELRQSKYPGTWEMGETKSLQGGT